MHPNNYDIRKFSKFLMCAITILTIFVISFTVFAFYIGNDEQEIAHLIPVRNKIIMDAESYTNCNDFTGVIDTEVKPVAKGNGYLHDFEYEKITSMLYLRFKKDIYSDITIITMTSSKTTDKALAIKESWANDDNLSILFISDEENVDVGSISFNDITKISSNIEQLDYGIIGLKHIYADKKLNRYNNKNWYLLIDDDTWVNIPALLNVLSKYNPDCPIILSYIWSGIWVEDLEYVSSAAGILISRAAYELLAPALSNNPECEFAHYNEIAFSKCTWYLSIQLIHHNGFYFDRPEQSKDRHEHVWYPPIGEALTYHGVTAADMKLMTNYVNERWQWNNKN